MESIDVTTEKFTYQEKQCAIYYLPLILDIDIGYSFYSKNRIKERTGILLDKCNIYFLYKKSKQGSLQVTRSINRVRFSSHEIVMVSRTH